MNDSDVLEHADRHDTVEPFRNVAVVLQAELRRRHSLLFRAGPRGRKLFLRKGDASHLRAADLSQVNREPAPSRADVEQPDTAFDQKLGRKMSLLGNLGIIKRLARQLEIGATVLAVCIEEKRIQMPV